jgi:hypothetical protein
VADIQHAIQIASTPETVYPLIATAGAFGQWWATDIAEIEGAVELGFFDRATVYRLRLAIDNPPVQAEWICETGDQWNGTHIIFRLEAGSSGSLLRFYFVSCNTTCGELMFRLKAAAEGKSPGPLFLASGTAY